MRGTGALAVLLAALAGCALQTPPTHTEVLDQALPEKTRIPAAWEADPQSGVVAGDWLKSFHDPMLDVIVAEALANNLDLRQAADRVEIARQSVVVVGAQLLPQIGGQLGFKKTHDFGNKDKIKDTDVEIKHTYHHKSASLGMAWELDVWGRLRAQREAAGAGFEASALDFAYARQSLAATVALSWYLTTEAYQLLALAERAVEVYGGLLDLAKIRHASGKSSELDVVDARARVETAQSGLEAARDAYGRARRALEVLLGRYPAAEIEAAAVYPPLPPPVGAGVPASLLERRPDLVAAERLVLAAFRQQEAARLALLPDFSISLIGEHLSDHLLRQLQLSPWLASAAIGTVIPIYEGGALRAQVKIATAQQAQAVANYGSVVLNAFREVEDVLASEQLLQKRLGYAQRALADRIASVRLATVQYQAGRRDLLWVEQLQTEQLAVEEHVIQLRNAQIANRIQLHLALGGSFDAAPAVAERADGG
jgi:NodT family efflux transporter outer membrane factor (OMF) lipoprotein